MRASRGSGIRLDLARRAPQQSHSTSRAADRTCRHRKPDTPHSFGHGRSFASALPSRDGCRRRSDGRHDLRRSVDFGNRRRRSEEHTSELQSQSNLVCRLLLEKKKTVDQATLYSYLFSTTIPPHLRTALSLPRKPFLQSLSAA